MDPELVCMIPEWFAEDGILYFTADDKGLQSDSFMKAEKRLEAQIFKNQEDYFLFTRPEDPATLVAEFYCPPDPPLNQATRLAIHFYEDSKPRPGLPVVFSTEHNNKTFCLQAEKRGDNMEVAFKAQDVPQQIDKDRSEIVFFKRRIIGYRQYFKFESTLEEGYFLAFDNNDPTRLIMKREVSTDDVDTNVMLAHSKH